MNLKLILRGGVLFGTLVALVVVLRVSGLDVHLNEQWVDTYVRGHGTAGLLTFIAGGALITAVGVPRQLVGFLGGYAFGLAAGTFWGVVAAALGCATAFYYARFLGRELVAHRFPGRVRKVDSFLADNPFLMTLLIRFLPVGSNLVTNLAAGVSSVNAPAFIGGSAVGYIPQTLIFALIGTGMKVDPALNIAVAVALFAVSGSLGVYLYKKYRHGKSIDDEINGDL